MAQRGYKLRQNGGFTEAYSHGRGRIVIDFGSTTNESRGSIRERTVNAVGMKIEKRIVYHRFEYMAGTYRRVGRWGE